MAIGIDSPESLRRTQRILMDHGVFPSWIRYPGADAFPFYRFSVSCLHTEADVDRLIGAVMAAFAPAVARRSLESSKKSR